MLNTITRGKDTGLPGSKLPLHVKLPLTKEAAGGKLICAVTFSTAAKPDANFKVHVISAGTFKGGASAIYSLIVIGDEGGIFVCVETIPVSDLLGQLFFS